MNARAVQQLRLKLARGKPVHGMWVTLEAPTLTEIGVAMGLDWIVIDAEHGHLDWKEIVEHLRAAARSGTVMLVRITEDNPGLIKRALDLGADGVVVPHVETADQLRHIMKMAHFPPAGTRGIGAERATSWGQRFAQHIEESATHTLVIPLLESVTGIKNLPEMLEVEGVEIFWFGPADHSASAGYAGQWEGPGIAEQIIDSIHRITTAGKNAGILVRNEKDLTLRQSQGVRVIGLGMDAGLFIASLSRMLAAATVNTTVADFLKTRSTTELIEQSTQRPLTTLPEAFRPDRPEVMNRPGSSPQIELASGVMLDCLVGKHNQARNLTTGIASFHPGAILPYHTHSRGESITVLEGEALVDVEGRRYRLEKMDNLTIPAGLAHQAVNFSSAIVKAHVALASSTPDRNLVPNKFSVAEMAQDAQGPEGKEHVVRFKRARRYAAGPNTEFIDHLNSDLIPGIEMSGGYGLFHKGGRLPAHIHDFDESICIIEGTAVCNVEGKRYTMSHCETALQPRGRVHYFINEAPEPMVMLWVYAGPRPERIIIDEAWTAPGSKAWQQA